MGCDGIMKAPCDDYEKKNGAEKNWAGQFGHIGARGAEMLPSVSTPSKS